LLCAHADVSSAYISSINAGELIRCYVLLVTISTTSAGQNIRSGSGEENPNPRLATSTVP